MNVHAPASACGPILSIEAVSKAFGGIQAAHKISFEVAQGIVQGVIGPNGAGKTTLFNLISGVFAYDSGSIRLRDMELGGLPMHVRVQHGIARTFQNVELFSSMTVLENVLVGRHVRTRAGFWEALLRTPRLVREERQTHAEAMALLEFVGLADQAQQRSGDLPFGWQRLLEIARAMAADPQLLLLDEPAAGLNAVETQQLGGLIDKIRDRGITVILVEHDMSLTMAISDRIAVLDQGKLLAQGTPRQIQTNPAVMAAYLGGSAQQDAADSQP